MGEVNDISIGGITFRAVLGDAVPDGFALFCNSAGWAAFMRGEIPCDGDAVLLKTDIAAADNAREG